jgi:hypothetical protein
VFGSKPIGVIYPSVIYQKKEETKAFKNPLNASKNFQGFGRDLKLKITHWLCYSTAEIGWYSA